MCRMQRIKRHFTQDGDQRKKILFIHQHNSYASNRTIHTSTYTAHRYHNGTNST